MCCSIPLEYTIRGDVVVVVYTSLDVTYSSSLILIKGCRLSVRADTTYVVSLVEHVVAYIVEYFVMVSCKCSCNILL